MAPRWLHRLAFLILFVAGPAYGQNAKLKKAEKALARAEDSAALRKALGWIEDAKAHPKTRDLPKTWVVYGDIARILASEEDGPLKDPVAVALGAYDAAIGLDRDRAYAERILEGLGSLEGVLFERAVHAYEAREYADAWLAVQYLYEVHRQIRQVGRVDPAREQKGLELAVLTALKFNLLDQARKYHAELTESYRAPVGVSLALATALAEEEGAEAALAFLEPLVERSPDDAALLGAQLEQLFALERPEAVRTILEANADSVGKALGITVLHAEAWDRIGDLERSAKAYEAALRLGPEEQRVLRGFADVEIRRATAFEEAAKASRRWSERRKHREARDAAKQRAIELLQRSRQLDPEHLPSLEVLLDLFEQVGWDDREEVATLEAQVDALKAREE